MLSETVRAKAKTVRDGCLRRTPGLQRLIRIGAEHGYVPRKLWSRLQPTGVWKLHAPDGTAFYYGASMDDYFARYIVWTDLRDWEETTQPVLFELARDAAVFVDVGAYSGIYTMLACAANPALRAVAIEPNPAMQPILRRNIALNDLDDRVTVLDKALSSNAGRARLTIPADDRTAASLHHETRDGRSVDVAVTTGDDALAGLPVDLIKIDVEGWEHEVLDGIAGLLGSRRPKLIVECLDQVALQRIHHKVSAHGYSYAYHLGGDGMHAIDHGFSPLSDRYANFLFSVQEVDIGRHRSRARQA
jgi:FkbM family methyltransferase